VYSIPINGAGRLPRAPRSTGAAALNLVLPWLDWTEDSALLFGVLKADLERAGRPVGDMDVIIGSVALGSGAGVATTNVRHFSDMRDLVVEDWS
jgi:tRNA(fMet)-specific endonuclease VapC